MKKFMRFAMVLALAGATLLYSGCTKDYQKSIDDLNTTVGSLQKTVGDLQTQVKALQDLQSKINALEKADENLQKADAALQKLIDECNANIAKIQANYATKAELEAGLEALEAKIKTTLDDLATRISKNEEAIAALNDAYKALGGFAESLNANKISSVVLVPSSPLWESAEQFELTVGDEFKKTLIETNPQLYLQYAVRPANLAANLTADNTALHVVADGEDVYCPVTILEADAESGNLYIVADLVDDLVDLGFFPFSLEISDVAEDGVLNNIKSPFNFAVNDGEATQLRYAAYDEETFERVNEFPAYEIPWNEYATSQREFFDGYSVGLSLGWGEDMILPLEQAAYCMHVDVEDITPDFTIAFTKDDDIKTDAEAWTAAMAATKGEDAVKAVGSSVTATAKAYFTVDYLPFYVLTMEQDYEVVKAAGKTITVDGYNFPWLGEDTTPAATLLNVAISEKLKNTISLVNADITGEITVTPDDELVTVAIPAGMFEFADEAQSYTFAGEIVNGDTQTVDVVEFTVTLDPKPADKELDFGKFYTDGSSRNSVKVALDGIVKKFVDGDEDLYKNFEETPLYAAIASKLNSTEKFTKVVVEYADGSVQKLPYQWFNYWYNMDLAYDNKESKDGSTLTFAAGAAVYGATVTFWGNADAYGVNYDYTFQVVVKPADFALVTTPMVEKVDGGNVIKDFAEIVNNKYTLEDVYFSDYFQINKVVEDQLYVNFAFDYEKDSKDAYYAGKATWGTAAKAIEPKANFEIGVAEADKLLRREGNFLNWGSYVGRNIFGTATLGYKVGGPNGTFVPVGEALNFTLVTPDPVKVFEVAAITSKDERVAGQPVKVDLASTLTLKSQIDNIPIVPTTTKAVDKEHAYSYYNLSYGYVKDGAIAAWPDKLEGTLNGEAFTFVKGTHYTVSGNEVTFLANNAYGDITFSVPVGISYCYNYDTVDDIANLDVTIPQHKQQ